MQVTCPRVHRECRAESGFNLHSLPPCLAAGPVSGALPQQVWLRDGRAGWEMESGKQRTAESLWHASTHMCPRACNCTPSGPGAFAEMCTYAHSSGTRPHPHVHTSCVLCKHPHTHVCFSMSLPSIHESTLYVYISHMCSHMDKHTCRCVHRNSCVHGVCPLTLLNKRAYFLYLTSKLGVIPRQMRPGRTVKHYFTRSFGYYFPSTHRVQGLMLRLRWKTQLGLRSAPPEHPVQGRGSHEPVDTVMPVTQSQHGARRLRAGSRLLSGDGMDIELPAQFSAPTGSWTFP